MKINQGLGNEIYWTLTTLEAGREVPLDLDPYDAVRVEFDASLGAVDLGGFDGDIRQVGSGSGAVNKGLVYVGLVEADSVDWPGDARVRAQWRVRDRASGTWYGSDVVPVVIIGRVGDTLE